MLAPDSTAAVTRGHQAAGASLGDDLKVMLYSLRRQLAYLQGSIRSNSGMIEARKNVEIDHEAEVTLMTITFLSKVKRTHNRPRFPATPLRLPWPQCVRQPPLKPSATGNRHFCGLRALHVLPRDDRLGFIWQGNGAIGISAVLCQSALDDLHLHPLADDPRAAQEVQEHHLH